MDVAVLARVLEATLESSTAIRNEAEEKLKAAYNIAGYSPALCQIVHNPHVPRTVRLAAALAFKRRAEDWDKVHRETRVPEVPEVDKAAVRANLINMAVTQNDGPILNALCDAFRWIQRHDYPDKWGALPGELQGMLKSGHPYKAYVALLFVRTMAKHYTAVSLSRAPGGGPMGMMATAIMPLVLRTAQVLVDGPHHGLDAARVVKVAVQAYNSCMEFRMQEYQAIQSPETTIAWCGVLDKLMMKPIPEPGQPGEPSGQPADPEHRAKWPWWQAKQWAVRALARLAERWGNPRMLDDDSPAMPSAKVFNKNIAPLLAEHSLGLIVAWHQGKVWLSHKFMYSLIELIKSVSDYGSVWRPLKPHLPLLIKGVAVHVLRLTPQDVKSYEEDPYRWIEQQNDEFGYRTSDPRASMDLLLYDLVRHRPKTVMPLIDSLIAETMAAYTAAARPELRDVPTKDAVLYIFSLLFRQINTSPKRKKMLASFLGTHVLPEFSNPLPLMRVRACQVFGMYIGSDALPPALVQAATRGVLSALQDKSFPVRFVATQVIGSFISSSQAARTELKPHIPLVMRILFGNFSELGSDELVTTLELIIEHYAEDMKDVAEPLTKQILHMLKESLDSMGDDEDDAMAGEMAASALMSSLERLIENLDYLEQSEIVQAKVLPHLWGPLQLLFNGEEKHMAVFEPSLNLLFAAALCLEFKLGDCEPAWITFAAACNAFKESGFDYSEAFFGPANTFASYGPQRLVEVRTGAGCASGVDFLSLLLECMTTVYQNGAEEELVSMSRLGMTLIWYGWGMADRILPELIKAHVSLILKTKLASSRTAAGSVIATALMYSVPKTLAVIQSMGPTMLQDLLRAWVIALPKCVRLNELVPTSLGLSTLLRSAAHLPAPVHSGLPQIVTALAMIIQKAQEVRTAAIEFEKELEKSEDEDDSDAEEDNVEAEDHDDDADSYTNEEDEALYREHMKKQEEVLADMRSKKEDAAKKTALLGVDGAAPPSPVAAAAAAAGGADKDDDDDDGLWFGGEEQQDSTTIMDHINVVLHFAAAIQALGALPNAAALQAALPDVAKLAVGVLMQQAAKAAASGEQPGALEPAEEDRPPSIRKGAAAAATLPAASPAARPA